MPDDDLGYHKHGLHRWMRSLASGDLRLPKFQRSYVWTPPKIKDLLTALIRNRPVGALLLIPDNRDRFASRPIKGLDESQYTNSAELVLDGQQRLTALWSAFKGDAELLVKVRNWNDDVLEFEDIWTLREVGIRGRPDHVTAAAFYEKQCFPFAILGVDSVTQDKDAGWKWCNKAMKDAGEAARVLWNKINYDFGEPLRNRDLWYLRLPASMSRKDAIDVYVKTNQSSAIIRKFDIAVALYDSQTDSSLRDEIVDMVREVAQGGELIRRFLGPDNNDFDEDDLIPELGELLLKVACLWTDLPPTESNYTKDKVLKTLRNKTQDFRDALIWSLEFYSQEGIPRRQFVPSYVPLRVLPALQPMLAKIPQKHKRKAIRVVRAYLWRAFLTDRYSRSANTRLHEDYKELKKALENPEALPEALDDTNLRKISPIFHKDDFRLPSFGNSLRSQRSSA